MMYSKSEVNEANIKLHSMLSDVYKTTEPHYRKENIERVDCIIKNIKNEINGDKLLDVGCGAGFIIDIAKKYFKEIDGIDITSAMMEKVDKTSEYANIRLFLSEIENMPFESNVYDVCTAYAVLHHLHNLEDAFKEIFRVLKSGGIFYSDLDPNYYFWKEFSEYEFNESYSDIINREILAVKAKDEELFEKFNIDKSVLRAAESLKHEYGGFKAEDIVYILKKIGFSEVKITYEWFVGEGKYINSEEKKNYVNIIENYLREAEPTTNHLFKYLRIIAKK